MTGIFNAGGGGGFGGGGGGGGFGGGGNQFMRDKKPGDKIFSDLFTLKSDVGNSILRQTPILNDNTPAAPVAWVEKGVLKNLAGQGTRANVNMSLSMEGSDLSIADMVKRGNLKSKDRQSAPRTVQAAMQTVVAILNSAVEDGLLPSNPAARRGRCARDVRRQCSIWTSARCRIRFTRSSGARPRAFT